MQYGQVEKGVFLARPNRFIALVALNGVETVCHVYKRQMLYYKICIFNKKVCFPD